MRVHVFHIVCAIQKEYTERKAEVCECARICHTHVLKIAHIPRLFLHSFDIKAEDGGSGVKSVLKSIRKAVVPLSVKK